MVASGDVDTFDREVRLAVYRKVVAEGLPPTAPEIASELGVTAPDVETSFQRLADAHVIVLAPGTPYIWMANPFSAIPTPFEVTVGERRYFANCIWDALGIPACLHADARIDTFCPDCSEPIRIRVSDDALDQDTSTDARIHFSVPAARWWEDIGAT